MEAKAYDSFQFMRNGYYCVDCKDSEEGKPVYNRIVSIKELLQASEIKIYGIDRTVKCTGRQASV